MYNCESHRVSLSKITSKGFLVLTLGSGDWSKAVRWSFRSKSVNLSDLWINTTTLCNLPTGPLFCQSKCSASDKGACPDSCRSNASALWPKSMLLAERFRLWPKQRPRLVLPTNPSSPPIISIAVFVVFRVIQREISNLVLNLIGFDNVEDFGRDICPCVTDAELRDPYCNLTRLVVFVPEKPTHSI